MTEREREGWRAMWSRVMREQQGTCAYPGCDAPMAALAHRISKSKPMLRRYGKAVIHARGNLVGVCRNPEHNDWFNIGCSPVAERELVAKINTALEAPKGESSVSQD